VTTALTFDEIRIIGLWSGHDPEQVEADPRLLEMGRMLIRDALTGIYNRRYLMSCFAEAARRSRSVVVAILDLDGFKQVNDTLGHDQGDRVLQAVAWELAADLKGAVVARLGGDEFAVLFDHHSPDAAALALERLLQALPERLADGAEVAVPVRFSAGVAAWPEDGADLSAVMRAADRAMYAAKRSGRRAVRLARDLAHAPGDAAGCGGEQMPLIGREVVWESLLSRLEEAQSGRGGVVFLQGPAGAGKSRLLQEVAEVAGAHGWMTVHTAPADDVTPYRPVERWLEALGTGRTGRSAAGSSLTGVGRRLRRALWRGAPVCLLVDDLPRADHLSLFSLRMAGRYLAKRRVLVIATGREDEGSAGWEGLRAEGAAEGWLTTLEVGGLTRADLGRLAAAMLPGAPGAGASGTGPSGTGPDLDGLWRLTGGNPLHAVAVLRASASASASVDATLRQALARWIGDQETEVRDWLGLGAVLGTRFDRQTLAEVSGAARDDLLDWEARAVRARVVVPDGDEDVRFAHSLLQQAAYAALSPQARRLAHRVAGEVLAAGRSAPAGVLARHFDLAGLAARAFPAHVAAGDQAMGAHDTQSARHHFERAWALLPAALDEGEYRRWYGPLALRLATAIRLSGDPRLAADRCADVLRHRAVLQEGDLMPLLLELGESARLSGAMARAEEVWQEATGLVDQATPALQALGARALGLRLAFSRKVGPQHLDEALALAAEAERLGHRQLTGEMATLVCAVLLQVGRQAESEQWNRRAIARLPLGSGPDAATSRMRAGLLAGTTARARRWFREALLAAAAVGDVQPQARILRVLGNLERGAGNWEKARQFYDQALQLCRHQGVEMERDRTLNELGMLLAWSGRLSEGMALCRSVAEAAALRGDHVTEMGARGRLAQALVIAGRPAEAVAELTHVERWIAPENVLAREQRIYRAEAYLALGDLPAARAQMEPIRDWDAVFATAAHRDLVVGAVFRAAGEPEEALRWLERALSLRGRPFVESYHLEAAERERGRALRELREHPGAGAGRD
jgi:diguanylate cyclase (GGDEF)-like protein